MMDIQNPNNHETFGHHLDQYEKAVARRDYDQAVKSITAAIETNPYAPLYAHLSTCHSTASASLATTIKEQNRKWYHFGSKAKAAYATVPN